MANKKSVKNANAINATPSIADQPTQKKISFFSAMFIVMGSSIGAGIFFKAKGVLESSQGSLVMAILAWLLAAFAVIAMALALVEIASARNDNLSLIGWCKVFCSRTVYKASKNFMAYIYLPLTYFFMPFYVIMSLQDAIAAFGYSYDAYAASGGDAFAGLGANTFKLANGHADWVIWFLISLCISAFFIFVSGMSSRAGNIMNMGIMTIKFIPLLATIILGFVIAGMNGVKVQAWTSPEKEAALSGITQKFDPTKLGFMSPGIGLFMAVGAIFFAYDGFYVTAGIQTEMKEPKKTPMAIVFGLGAVTVIYLLIAIAMSLGGNGGLFGFIDFLADKKLMWVFGVLNLTIAIGVLGIINGFAMWAPRFVEDLIKENELPFAQKYMNRLNSTKPMVGIWYEVIITVPVVLVFTIIGALGYYIDGQYAGAYGTAEMEKLYTFCDLTGTWTAVFAFMFIMLPIAGGLKNRKSQWVKTDEKSYFKWTAWVSVIIISIVLAFLFLDAFVNVFILMNWNGFEYTAAAAYSKDGLLYAKELVSNNWTDEIVGRVMKLVTLFIFAGLMIIPTLIEDKLHVKKYGSIEKYERALNIEPCLRK